MQAVRGRPAPILAVKPRRSSLLVLSTMLEDVSAPCARPQWCRNARPLPTCKPAQHKHLNPWSLPYHSGRCALGLILYWKMQVAAK